MNTNKELTNSLGGILTEWGELLSGKEAAAICKAIDALSDLQGPDWESACKNESKNCSKHQRISVEQGEEIESLQRQVEAYDKSLERISCGDVPMVTKQNRHSGVFSLEDFARSELTRIRKMSEE